MSSSVQCVICDTVLAYDRENTWNLIEHLQDFHRHDWKRPSSSKRHSEHRQTRKQSGDIVLELENLPVMVKMTDHDRVQDHDHGRDYDHDHRDCPVRDVIDRAVGSTEVTVADKVVGQSPASSDQEDSESMTSRDALEEKLIKEHRRGSKKKKTMYKRMYQSKKSFRSGRVLSYRTTVETWRPGGLRIQCPACGRNRIPVVKAPRDHETSSSAWSSFLMCCWPFWCLPCCFPKPKREYLYCSACDAFLAMYDYDMDCIQPNFDLFEAG